jgi:hypothetical protein
VERTRGRPVRELVDRVGDAAPDGGTVVIILRCELIRARGAFLECLSPKRFSIRVAARQMSISGITRDKLHGSSRQSFNTALHALPARESPPGSYPNSFPAFPCNIWPPQPISSVV